jgi:hypothetical protein
MSLSTLCCEDADGNWLLDNLRMESILEIWGSEKLLSIKRIHKEKRFRDL